MRESPEEGSDLPGILSVPLPDFIDEDETDFTDIPEEEEEAALIYELARHVPHVVEEVEANISKYGSDEIPLEWADKTNPILGGGILRPQKLDGEERFREIVNLGLVSSISRHDNLSSVDPVVLFFLTFAGGFPDYGWSSLHEPSRMLRLIINFVMNRTPVLDVSHLLDDEDDPIFKEPPGKGFRKYAEAVVHRLRGNYSLQAIGVDWRASNDEIVKAFGELLKEMRPESIPERSGTGAVLAKHFEIGEAAGMALRHLGIWRLKNMSVDDKGKTLDWNEVAEKLGKKRSQSDGLKAQVNRSIRQLRQTAEKLFPVSG
jgi:hypothetical protein